MNTTEPGDYSIPLSPCGDMIARLAAILNSEPHPLSLQFYEALIGCAELHAAKQADYGRSGDPFANVRASQEFGIAPWLGAVMRLNDKVSRLKSFARKGELKNESVEDSLRDISVYALIALVLFNESRQQPERGPSPISTAFDAYESAKACERELTTNGIKCRLYQPLPCDVEQLNYEWREAALDAISTP